MASIKTQRGGPKLHKLTLTGIGTLVAAIAVASNAAATIDKPGPGLLGPPVPAPVAPKPSSTTPPKAPIKLPPPVLTNTKVVSPTPVGKPTLTSPQPIRIPAF
jgi:hypothetical protein